MIPLLSPRPFAEYSPAEYHLYIKSLYKAPPVKVPPAEVSVRLNEKGNPVISVKRDPKVISREEAEQLARDCGLPLQTMWLALLARKIQVTVPRKESRRGRYPRP